MTLRKLLALSCLLLPMIASAHKFETDQRVPPVGIADRGELILDNDKFSYKSWNSAQLPGKVRIVQHIAGRTSAKEKNATLIEAIKAANLPHDKYQTTTIVNTDDAIPGSGMFVRSSLESNKELRYRRTRQGRTRAVGKRWRINAGRGAAGNCPAAQITQ